MLQIPPAQVKYPFPLPKEAYCMSKIVGNSEVRVDAFDKATGRTKYYDLLFRHFLFSI